MSESEKLLFYRTPPHECSYLEDQQASAVFANPRTPIDTRAYSSLTALGFRRSGEHLYRPDCGSCQACIPVRVPVADFRPNRRQRRIWQRNHDLQISESAPEDSDEAYGLYARYIRARHDDGDMFPPNREQFCAFLVGNRPEGRFVKMRLGEELIGIAVMDVLDDAVSAIYTFFEPTQQARSPGVFAVLWLIESARRRQLPHVYLGYWIQQCRKMRYKTDYQPIEMYLAGRWQRQPAAL